MNCEVHLFYSNGKWQDSNGFSPATVFEWPKRVSSSYKVSRIMAHLTKISLHLKIQKDYIS